MIVIGDCVEIHEAQWLCIATPPKRLVLTAPRRYPGSVGEWIKVGPDHYAVTRIDTSYGHASLSSEITLHKLEVAHDLAWEDDAS